MQTSNEGGTVEPSNLKDSQGFVLIVRYPTVRNTACQAMFLSEGGFKSQQFKVRFGLETLESSQVLSHSDTLCRRGMCHAARLAKVHIYQLVFDSRAAVQP